MRHPLLAVLAIAAAACGGTRPAAVAPAPTLSSATEPNAVDASPKRVEPRRRVSTYVKIDYDWVESHLDVDAAEAAKWGAANPTRVASDFRQVVVKVAPGATPAQEATAKKKASNILAQARKGSDFVKLVKAYSDDPVTKERGGTVDAILVPLFADDIQKTYASLAPGEVAKALVRSPYGWHVIRKEKPTARNIEAAYRAYQASITTTKLAEVLAHKLSARAPVGSIDASVREVLGPAAAADARALVRGVVAIDDYPPHAKLGDACTQALAVGENEVELVQGYRSILVVRGDEGVPGRDVAGVCPPVDVQVAESAVDTAPRLAVREPSVLRE